MAWRLLAMCSEQHLTPWHPAAAWSCPTYWVSVALLTTTGLASILTTTLIRKDLVGDRVAAREILRSRSLMRIEVVPGAGHHLPISHPELGISHLAGVD